MKYKVNFFRWKSMKWNDNKFQISQGGREQKSVFKQKLPGARWNSCNNGLFLSTLSQKIDEEQIPKHGRGDPTDEDFRNKVHLQEISKMLDHQTFAMKTKFIKSPESCMSSLDVFVFVFLGCFCFCLPWMFLFLSSLEVFVFTIDQEI